MNPVVSIVIPNWNGTAFLEECLQCVITSAEACRTSFEILVIDDGSTDHSRDVISGFRAHVRMLENEKNAGFGATCNRGAAEARGDLLVLLNNDLAPEPPMIGALIRPLVENSRVFGVSGKTVAWDQSKSNHVNMAGSLQDGNFKLTYQESRTLSPTMFLQGGACAVRRSVFLQFGGFCPLYYPGYWEDYDVSYQALKAGWENVYNPEAVGRHIGQGSMVRAYGEDRIIEARYRNRLLFTLLNFTDNDVLTASLKKLPTLVAYDNTPRLKSRVRALWDTVTLTSQIIAERRKRIPNQKCSDREIFAKFSGWRISE